MDSRTTKAARRLEILTSIAARTRDPAKVKASRGTRSGCAYLLFLSVVARYYKASLLAQLPIVSVETAAAQPRWLFARPVERDRLMPNEQRRKSRAVDVIIAGEVLR